MITVTTNHGSLGDNLWITPLFKNGRKGKVIATDIPTIRSLMPLFDGLAEIEFVAAAPDVSKSPDQTHEAQRILNYYGISDVNCIPQIKLTPEEVEWARDFLSPYENPIVVIADNSGSSDPNNYRARYVVRPPVENIQYLCDSLRHKHSLLQFGLKPDFYRLGYSNFTKLDGTIEIRGLPIRKLAACYHVCGKYIGGDTGDYHLMLAVGGKAVVSVPPANEYYNTKSLLYHDSLWKGELTRVRYFAHDYYDRIGDLLTFDF